MQRKSATVVIDSRHLKILAMKKELLKDAIVFVCLDEEKYGKCDKEALRKLVGVIDNQEPSGVYFPLTKKISVDFYDKSEFKNKDILVTIGQEDPNNVDKDEVEEAFAQALSQAKSIGFVHTSAKIVRKS